MSKLRQQLDLTNDSDISVEPETDLTPYVIFTQLKKDGPYIYAGWLDAPDDEMALVLAKEHYGQDQQCTAIWAVPRRFVGGMRVNIESSKEAVSEPRAYQIFTQQDSGDQHVSSIVIESDSAFNAIQLARQRIDGAAEMHNLWAVPVEEIVHTDTGELIWRNTDQSYRLARGYAKDVREKWTHFRQDKDLKEYEKDDLQEMF